MAKASDILSVAKKEIGVVESPPNSNKVKYNTEYYGYEAQGLAYPWCCAFVWWVFKKANASSLFYDGKKTAYCPTVESWGKANNLIVDKTKGKPGDIVLFDFSGNGLSGHIGIIESVVGSSYICIEGNTSTTSNDNGGAVMRRTRNLSVIRCIIRPKYTTSTTTTTTVKEEVKTVNIELKVLQKGSEGKQVKTLQRLLRMLGYKDQYGNTLVIDGDFGAKTDHALKSFQKAMGLVVDGVCGEKSWSKLLK